MRIKLVKTIVVSNKSGQSAEIIYNDFLDYIHGAIAASDTEHGKRHKVALIKLVRARMEAPGLREAKIFVEDALGQ